MAKFHKIIGLLFISQIHNNNALNLSTDLNTLSLKEIDHYLDEAAEILDIYPRGMGKMNEEVGPLPMSKNNRLKRSYNIFSIEDCGDLDNKKLNRCLRIYGVCGQYIEILRSKLITINLNTHLQDNEEDDNDDDSLARSINADGNTFTARKMKTQAKLSETEKVLDRVIKKINTLKDRTSQYSEKLDQLGFQRSSSTSTSNVFSNEELIHAIDDNNEPSLVEVYHNSQEAKEAHKLASEMGTIPLGLDVREMISLKNDKAVCSIIRLKLWNRFCEPCVEGVEEGSSDGNRTPSSTDEEDDGEHSGFQRTTDENDIDMNTLVADLESVKYLPTPPDFNSDVYKQANDLGLNFGDK